MITASWVIRRKDTKAVLFETWLPKLVANLNTDKYEAIPILDYLIELNARIQQETIRHA